MHGHYDLQHLTNGIKHKQRSAHDERELIFGRIGIASSAHGRLETPHRVIADVAYGPTPKTRQPRNRRRTPTGHERAESLPWIDSIENFLAIGIDPLEPVSLTANEEIRLEADEAVPTPFLSTCHAFQ